MSVTSTSITLKDLGRELGGDRPSERDGDEPRRGIVRKGKAFLVK